MPGWRLPGRPPGIERVVARRDAEQLVVAAAEARDGRLVEQHLARPGVSTTSLEPCRWSAGSADRRRGAARPRRRRGRGAPGASTPGGKMSTMSPAEREFARLHHRADALVAVARPGSAASSSTIEPGRPTAMRRAGMPAKASRGGTRCRKPPAVVRTTLPPCSARVRRASVSAASRSPAMSALRRDPVVGQAVPGREVQDLDVGREEAERIGQRLAARSSSRATIRMSRPGARRQASASSGQSRPSGAPQITDGVDPVKTFIQYIFHQIMHGLLNLMR